MKPLTERRASRPEQRICSEPSGPGVAKIILIPFKSTLSEVSLDTQIGVRDWHFRGIRCAFNLMLLPHFCMVR